MLLLLLKRSKFLLLLGVVCLTLAPAATAARRPSFGLTSPSILRGGGTGKRTDIEKKHLTKAQRCVRTVVHVLHESCVLTDEQPTQHSSDGITPQP